MCERAHVHVHARADRRLTTSLRGASSRSQPADSPHLHTRWHLETHVSLQSVAVQGEETTRQLCALLLTSSRTKGRKPSDYKNTEPWVNLVRSLNNQPTTALDLLFISSFLLTEVYYVDILFTFERINFNKSVIKH